MADRRADRKPDRWQRAAGWFLVLSYGLGAPAYAVVEAQTGLFSARFDYPPAFLYLVSGTQFVCALALFVRSLVPWSCAVLTVLALGAVASHVRIDSPLTALPAAGYVLVQAWYGLRVYRQDRGPGEPGTPRAR